MLAALLHPDAPHRLAPLSTGWPRALMSLSFALGILSLLLGVACSGWLHSRRVGWWTTGIAAAGIVLVALLTVQVG